MGYRCAHTSHSAAPRSPPVRWPLRTSPLSRGEAHRPAKRRAPTPQPNRCLPIPQASEVLVERLLEPVSARAAMQMEGERWQWQIPPQPPSRCVPDCHGRPSSSKSLEYGAGPSPTGVEATDFQQCAPSSSGVLPPHARPSHWACRFAHSRRWRPVGRRRKARASLTAPLCVQTTCQSGLDRMCSADGCLARGERATCTTAGAHRRASRLPSSGCTARRAIGAPFAALHATSVSDSQPAPPLALVAGRRPSLSRCGSSPPPATPTSAHSLTTAASMASTT